MAKQRGSFFLNKYFLTGLVAGLLMGPLITSSLGWQINPSTLGQAVDEAEIALQVKVCVAEAKAAGGISPTSTTETRYNLARKWAKMPWQDTANETVFNQCYNSLG